MSPRENPPAVEPASKPATLWGTAALEWSRAARKQRQSEYACRREEIVRKNRYYHENVFRLLRFIVEKGKRVLDIRCSSGIFLNAVEPSRGVGIDITPEMVDVAHRTFPHLEFHCADPESLDLREEFDYILFNNVFDTVDLLAAFQRLRSMCQRHTRLVIYSYNHLWQPILDAATKVGLRERYVEPNWITDKDLKGILELTGFEVLKGYNIVLCPKWIPLVSEVFNRFLARLPGLRKLCLIKVFVARPAAVAQDPAQVSVSVIIPCRNERDNVEPAVSRIPPMGRHTEIIFCDDKSTDGTADEICRVQALHPNMDIRLEHGPGICKAENVWTGFHAATGDILMILDGDLAVMPEELPYFFRAMVEGRAEFINGSRLVYLLGNNAMKFTNLIGNKLFSVVFSFLLGQHVKDTLCGTKVIWRRDWQRIRPLVGTWGVKDLWGDYELLFAASKLHLCIRDMPVHYQERIYGVTKMKRVFANGVRMLRLCLTATLRLKGGF
jgi:SAM-dependent methyltransferase